MQSSNFLFFKGRTMKLNKLHLVGMLCAAGLFSSTAALAADTANVGVSATVQGVCKFNAGAKTVSFVLDPSLNADVNGTYSQPAFFCTNGTSYTISDNDGLHSPAVGVQRMRHSTLAEFIPYTFTYTASGTGTGASNPINMNIASTVTAASFLNASVGSYADTVVLSITP
jgi:spore coat protein U-like protein